MKRKILMLLILFIIPLKIHALTGDVVLNCDKTSIKVNDEVTCTVSVNVTNGGLVSFKGKVELSSNLELVSASKDSGWQGDDNTPDFMLYTDVAKNGSVVIGTVVAKGKTNTNSTESFTVTGISLGDEEWNENEKANVVKQITLTATGASENPPAEDPPAEDPTEDPADNPEIPGGTGEGDPKSSNADIRSLEIEGHSINFSKSTTSYTIKLSDEEETLGLTVILDDEKAKYTVSNNYRLVNGDTVTITVTAEDDTQKNYYIKIEKDVQQDVVAPKTDINIPTVQVVAALMFIGVTLTMIIVINKRKETV